MSIKLLVYRYVFTGMQAPLQGVIPSWKIVNSSGSKIAGGDLQKTDIALGKGQSLGSVQLLLSRFDKSTKLIFVVSVAEFESQWELWVYPVALPVVDASGVFVCNRLVDKAREVLKKGGAVFFLAYGQVTKGAEVATGYSTMFLEYCLDERAGPSYYGYSL